jgi:adenylate cyclase
MQLLPWVAKKRLLPMVLVAFIVGNVVDQLVGNPIDYWIHDAAVVFQARTEWEHTAIVVLDDAIPVQVTRLQALPLFGRASEKLIAAGAKGLFLDANLPKDIEGVMPYALCIEQNDAVRWSEPKCLTVGKQCQLRNSIVGNAPLKMSAEVFPFFRVAPYLPGQESFPDFLLYDSDAEAFIPKTGLVAFDRLIRNNSASARWMDLSEQHAAITLAKFIDPKHVTDSLSHDIRDVCEQNLPCRRVRFSRPVYTTQFSLKKPIIPVSKLASCDDKEATKTAALLKNRVVILQLTTPNEATDVHITPFTAALLGPHLLTPGAQYLADAVETLLMNDHPREPYPLFKWAVLLITACLGVYASVYLRRPHWLWVIGMLLFLAMAALCFLAPITQLWPVSATLLTFIVGGLEGIALHLLIGFKEGNLMVQYMPQQVHTLLLSLKENESFGNQRHQAIVLMSDLASYTTVTGIVKEPTHILELMNDYLNETSYILQRQYDGWLETYIGDMVCYYWPFKNTNETHAYQNALKGALELSALQKRFFTDLPVRYQNKFDNDALQNISGIINAGIGLSSGTVVMGDLGPKRGVRKFGILGDPVNLTSRVESLTRYFNTEIIITADFLSTAKLLGYPTRRLGCFRVKGREQAETLYAVGFSEDHRFQAGVIKAWEYWLAYEEREPLNQQHCPDIFKLDQESLRKWKVNNFLHAGIWILDFK